MIFKCVEIKLEAFYEPALFTKEGQWDAAESAETLNEPYTHIQSPKGQQGTSMLINILFLTSFDIFLCKVRKTHFAETN